MSEYKASDIQLARVQLELSIATELGRLVIAFGDLVTGLYLCVAWFDGGKKLDERVTESADQSVNWLINRIVKQSKTVLPANSEGQRRYKAWADAAHQLRTDRNSLMHARWGFKPLEGIAMAVTSPILAKRVEERLVTPSDLSALASRAIALCKELSALRSSYPI